ncbi:MAG: HD domain-containing protein [Bryobacteraceae bacterium]
MDAQVLRRELAAVAPGLWHAISEIALSGVEPILLNLERKPSSESFPKTINDPVWGSIELYPWEIAILDSPLLQRLRGVSQLGLARYAYPGASHSRLEHVLGVLEAADRMMRALDRNAQNHRDFGRDRGTQVPYISELDRRSVRLAALLHDTGHGPFSHVTEPLLRRCFEEEFDAAEKVLRGFEGVTKIATSETIAVLFVMTDEMRRVFEHANFEAVKEAGQLAPAIAARILGSRSGLQAGYLSGVISGPIDADKIDYMARDSHHSGFPIGLDLNRLISKLEVIIITKDNAPNDELRHRAANASGGRVYEIGISLSGLGAYEQMIIGRVLLYDRLYYHHKVRASEAMLRRLVELAAEESSQSLELGDFFELFSEGDYISVWSGLLESDSVFSGGSRSRELGSALLSRQVYHRAFAFAPRFIAGLEGLPEKDRQETRQIQWDEVVVTLRSEEGRTSFAREVHELASRFGSAVPELAQSSKEIRPEHVLIDFPTNKTVVRGNDILTRTETGEVILPNLFFDPEKWSQAYEHQKQIGHVFAPSEHVPLVCLASRIAFYEKFSLVLGPAADNAAKTVGLVKPEWIRLARDHQLCSVECAETLTEAKPNLLRIRSTDFELPAAWMVADPQLTKRLADGFDEAITGGLPAGARSAVLKSVTDLALFMERVESDGTFVKHDKLPEKELQQELKKHLLSRGSPVREGQEVGGGETDLIVHDAIVVENKVRGDTVDPFESGQDYQYQSRRYSIPMLQRVSFVVVAYKPTNEGAILPLPQRIQVSKIEGIPEEHLQIRIVIPWGTGVPSSAKAPKKIER